MKGFTRFVCLWLTLVFLGGMASNAMAQDFPKVTGYVSDYSGKLSPATRDSLNTILSQYDKDTSIQFVVLIVDSLNGLEINDYANKLFRAWGIGQAGKDNGLLLLWVPSLRKIRFEVGYGLEGDMTDAQSGRVGQEMAPLMKAGNFDAAITLGVKEAMRILGPTPYDQREVERNAAKERTRAFLGSAFLTIVFGSIFLCFVTAIVIGVNRKRERLRLRLQTMESNIRLLHDLPGNMKSLVAALEAAKKNLDAVPANERGKRYASWLEVYEAARVQVAEFGGRFSALFIKCPIDGPEQAEVHEQELIELQGQLLRADGSVRKISGELFQLAQVRAEMPELLTATEKLLESHIDLSAGSSEAQSLYGRAEASFQQAQELSKVQPYDWLGVAELLDDSRQLVDLAVESSKPKPVPTRSTRQSGFPTVVVAGGMVNNDDDSRRSSYHDDDNASRDDSPSVPDTPDFGGGDSGGGGATTDY